jgi:hypothetical protein
MLKLAEDVIFKGFAGKSIESLFAIAVTREEPQELAGVDGLLQSAS